MTNHNHNHHTQHHTTTPTSNPNVATTTSSLSSNNSNTVNNNNNNNTTQQSHMATSKSECSSSLCSNSSTISSSSASSSTSDQQKSDDFKTASTAANSATNTNTRTTNVAPNQPALQQTQMQTQQQHQQQQQGGSTTAVIPTKLYVTNFPFTCSQRQIHDLFSRYGQVVECTLKKDYYAYILYTNARGAQTAFKNANGLRMLGRKLTVHLATSKKSQSHLNHPNMMNSLNTNSNSTRYITESYICLNFNRPYFKNKFTSYFLIP